jgi:hypothetical protein
VIVGSIPGVSPIRARYDQHDGVRIAVNVRVVDVGGIGDEFEGPHVCFQSFLLRIGSELLRTP